MNLYKPAEAALKLKTCKATGEMRTGWCVSNSRLSTRFTVLTVCAALAGCESAPQPVAAGLSPVASSAVLSSDKQTLLPQEIPPRTAEKTQDRAYRLGPNDVIAISVYLHPELSSPQVGSTSGLGGVLVTSDGTIDLPLAGNVDVDGKTISQAERAIVAAYTPYIVHPNVSIQLVQAQSLRYYLLGSFSSPGVKYPGHAMTILDALALGGSVDIGNADLYQAYVADDSGKLPVDFHALLLDGDLSQNVTLGSGATIVIPPTSAEDAFVFGAVGKPGAVPFQTGSLSLLQALSVADLDLTNYTAARLAQVHIIRSHGRSAEFIVVDAARIIAGQALPFELQPGDIVFVPPTGVASWNQVLSMLLPSLNTISGVLNPFVSIKYLSQKQ